MSTPLRGRLSLLEVLVMKYVYPAVFTPDGDGFLVDFPDLPHCYTDGDTLQEAFDNAEDALALCLYNLENTKAHIPAPSAPAQVSANGGTVALVKADTLPVRKMNDTRSIRKNVTIPGWMDTIVQEHNGNFSQLLQNAICKAYNLEMA